VKDAVIVEPVGPGIAKITLNRPERLNAMNHELVAGLYDALGGESRAAPHANAFVLSNGVLQPVPENLRTTLLGQTARLGQRNRCPGAADVGTAWRPSSDYNCDPTQVLPGSPEAKTG